jgi:hypothetical protein
LGEEQSGGLGIERRRGGGSQRNVATLIAAALTEGGATQRQISAAQAERAEARMLRKEPAWGMYVGGVGDVGGARAV